MAMGEEKSLMETFQETQFEITVKTVKSTANDCGSCRVAGISVSKATTLSFPRFMLVKRYS